MVRPFLDVRQFWQNGIHVKGVLWCSRLSRSLEQLMLITGNEGRREGNESLLITFSVPGTFHVFLLIPPVIPEVDVNVSVLQMRKLELRKTKVLASITQLVNGRARIWSQSVCLQNPSLPPTGCCFCRGKNLGSQIIDNHTSIPPPFHRPERQGGVGGRNGHQEKLPKACISMVAELGMAQESAQVLTRGPEARKVLHFLPNKRYTHKVNQPIHKTLESNS